MWELPLCTRETITILVGFHYGSFRNSMWDKIVLRKENNKI